MPYYIATYLGLPGPSPTVRSVPVAICPAGARLSKSPASETPPDSLERPLSYIVSVAVTNLLTESSAALLVIRMPACRQEIPAQLPLIQRQNEST